MTRLVGVESQEIDRLVHLREIVGVGQTIRRLPEDFESLLRVAAETDRVHPPGVVEVMAGIHRGGGDSRGLDGRGIPVHRAAGASHRGVAHETGPGTRRPDRLDRVPVRPHRVVTRDQLIAKGQLQSGRVSAIGVTVLNEDLGFVQRDPVGDAVTEPSGHEVRIGTHPVGAVATEPATLFEERRRHVPVEEGDPGSDARGQQPVDQSIVEIQPGLVGGADAFGKHPRPGDRETVGVKPQILHDLDITAETVIVITGDRTGVSILDRALAIAEVIPDASSPASLEGGSFDLVRRGSGSPKERFRKSWHS